MTNCPYQGPTSSNLPSSDHPAEHFVLHQSDETYSTSYLSLEKHVIAAIGRGVRRVPSQAWSEG